MLLLRRGAGHLEMEALVMLTAGGAGQLPAVGVANNDPCHYEVPAA